ncbi:RmlC-like cupin domain-containing protein [Blastocladiella britannica]|nr:RmlC-like cupin domain-containing protein [Blastocladiella britannica]
MDVDSTGVASESDDDSAVPVPADMAELVALLKQEMGPNGLDSASTNIPRILALMGNYASNPADWAKYALFDPCRYTRNLVDDGNGKFNLMLLCWGPGHTSPIHDHDNSHCCLKVLSGAVTETRFAWPGDGRAPEGHVVGVSEVVCEKQAGLVRTGEAVLASDGVEYMHDKLGLHRVANCDSVVPAITLHLYSPPIQMASTFCERTGNARPSAPCTFFSVDGVRVPACTPAGVPLADLRKD